MKGQEVIDHIINSDMPDFEYVREKCIRQQTSNAQRSKRLVLRVMTTAASLAVLVFVFYLFDNSDMQPHNSFSITAHAVEQQGSGPVTVQDDTTAEIITWNLNDSERSFTYNDLRQSIQFFIEGENIKEIEIIADGRGNFTSVRYLTENGELVESEHGLTVLSETYLGNSFNFNDMGSLLDGYVILTDIPGFITASDSDVVISVIATFEDNTTQTELVRIDVLQP